jgi:hypothetical protein
MKKLTTFLAASLLGLSSLASAAPSLEVHAGGSIRVTASASASAGSASAHGSVVVRDHRTPAPVYRPIVEQQVPVYTEVTWQRPAPAWITLGTVATGKQTIVPSDRLLDSLTFDIEGRVEIEKVAIYFEGQTSPQISKLDTVLTEGMRMPIIDLAGSNREIKRVIVYSTASNRGEITVLGRNDRDAAQIVMPGWSKLAALGTGKQMFTLESERRYSSLALVGSGSNIELEQVVVHYTDGTAQTFELDAMLGTNRRAAAIELQNKKVKSVIVYTDADARGDVMLFAK